MVNVKGLEIIEKFKEENKYFLIFYYVGVVLGYVAGVLRYLFVDFVVNFWVIIIVF